MNKIYVNVYQIVILRKRSIGSRQFTVQVSFLFVVIFRATPVTSELLVVTNSLLE